MTSRRCSEHGRPGPTLCGRGSDIPLGATAALILVILIAAAPAVAERPVHRVPNERVVGPAEVLEGDRVSIGDRPIRLMGIDAPDPGQVCLNRYGSGFDCFAVSVGVLRALISGAEVECTMADRDRTGQEEGECRARGIDLGGAMVARGWAFAYRSLTPAYQQGEAFAMTRRLGLWSGRVEKPWQWRSRQLRQSAR